MKSLAFPFYLKEKQKIHPNCFLAKTGITKIQSVVIIGIVIVAFAAYYVSTSGNSEPSVSPSPTSSITNEPSPTVQIPAKKEVTINKIEMETNIGATIDQTTLYIKITAANTEDNNVNAHYKVVVARERESTYEGDFDIPKSASPLQLPTITTTFSREKGEYDFNISIVLSRASGEVLTIQNLTQSLSTMRIGNTISLGTLNLTLMSWKESTIAVNGPYSDGYYTFTAKNDSKFIIIFFKFENIGTEEAQTPFIDSAEVFTDNGSIYEKWSPPLGIQSTEYDPRLSTEQEIQQLIGNTGAYQTLSPEKAVQGCIIFEVQKDTIPIDAKLKYINYLTLFS